MSSAKRSTSAPADVKTGLSELVEISISFDAAPTCTRKSAMSSLR